MLDLDKTRSSVDAVADVPRILSADIASMVGHTDGGSALDATTPNPAPPNPGTGEKGHDHSGGYYGRPLYRTTLSLTCDLGSQDPTRNLTTNGDEGFVHIQQVAPSEERAAYPYGGPVIAWMPGCDLVEGAYSLQALTCRAVVTDPTNVQSLDGVEIRIRNLHPSMAGTATAFPLPTLTAGTKLVISDSDDGPWVPIVPGVLNPLEVEVRYVASSNGAGPPIVYRAIKVRLFEFNLGVRPGSL